MKTIKTQKYNIDRCYLGLNSIQPKEFKTIEEIENASKVLEELKEVAEDYNLLIKKGEPINERYDGVSEESPEYKDFVKEVQGLNREIKVKEDKDRKKEIKLDLEDADFNNLFQFFEKWGKFWFTNVPEFLSFRKDLNETNAKSDKKKK